MKAYVNKTLNLEVKLINEVIDLSYYKSGQKAIASSILNSTNNINSIKNIGKILNNHVEIKK